MIESDLQTYAYDSAYGRRSAAAAERWMRFMKEDTRMKLFGRNKNASQENAFDLNAGVILKGTKWKKWKLTEEYIEIGKDRVPISDMTAITNEKASDVPKIPGSVTIYLKDRKPLSLVYPYEQKGVMEQAAAYIQGKISDAFSQHKDPFSRHQTALAEIDAFRAGKERRMRCNACGHLFCYGYQDLLNCQEPAKQAKSIAIRELLKAMDTSQVLGAQQQAEAERILSQMKDFFVCPNCHSADLKQLTDEEYQAASAAKNAPAAPSAADK